jgi:DNA (cytosine-5)-methyltransferase 1
MSANRLTALSAFTGLGGLDLGLEAAGFRTVGCIEIDELARRSLKANRPEWPILEPSDVQIAAQSLRPGDLGLVEGDLGLLAGAPPCQPYSKAAMWNLKAWNGLEDHRATPLHGFLKLAETFLPAAILMENVPGFVRGRHSALEVIEQALTSINERRGTSYKLDHQILHADHYGVPQSRQRAILIALRDGTTPSWPAPTHLDAPCRTWDALHDLDEELTPAPRMTGKWADLLPSIPEGWNYLWHTNRGGGQPLFGYRTRYWSFLLKLAKAGSAWTIPAQPGPAIGPFHWDNRPLRTSEMLRLQTFPHSWIVEGDRREQVRQVGNATPPLLGELIGRTLVARTAGQQPPTPPTHGIVHAHPVPDPETPSDVPARYTHLIKEHPDHPGTGLGPNPRDVP